MIEIAKNHTPFSLRNLKGMSMHDHRAELPLDYSQPDGSTIKVFAHEVVASL